MSLLEEFKKPCVILEKTRKPDGAGGYITTWSEGAEFYSYRALDTSTEATIAERQGISSIYSVLVEKNVPIEYGDYFKDKTTGRTYRVTSEPSDKQSPKSSSMQLKYFTAEKWELTT